MTRSISILFLTLLASLLGPARGINAQSATRMDWLPTPSSLPPGEHNHPLAPARSPVPVITEIPTLPPPSDPSSRASRRVILLTGYWPPSNSMLRTWSPNPDQNPNGWTGRNWEGRGYDIYAYFPEFSDPSCQNCGRGRGDLEVDYQDTSQDFWRIANPLQPVAIVTFSRGNNNRSWEVETNQFNRQGWIPDYLSPNFPTPSPPDASVPAEFLRVSTLPRQAIADAINAANLNINGVVCTGGDGGGFLSEFAAYHGVWYQSLHASPSDPAYCVAAGHVHVGGALGAEAASAAKVTVRTVIDHVNTILGAPGGTVSLCGAGGVNAACGDPEKVLRINNSAGGRARAVTLDRIDPLQITLDEPSSRQGDSLPTRFALYGFPGIPGQTDRVTLPRGLGEMCFGPFALATQTPLITWNSIGSQTKLGPHTAGGTPPFIQDGSRLTLVSRQDGSRPGFTITLQGVIEDNCSLATVPYSITNGIVLTIK